MADERTRIEELEAELARARALLAAHDSAIAERDSAIAERDSAIVEKDAALEEAGVEISKRDDAIRLMHLAIGKRDDTIRLLRAEVAKLCRQIYGRSTEGVDADQLLLAFEEARAAGEEVELPPEFLDEAPDGEDEPAKSKRRNGRAPLSPLLPRERIEVPLTDEQRLCDCGCERVPFGEDITEVLDYTPACLRVLEYVRTKVRCEACPASIHQASPPDLPILKGRPSAELLAAILLAKFGDHLPLARQARRFKRLGQVIRRQTLMDWVRDATWLLRRIADAIAAEVLATPVIQTDETGIRVRDPTRKPAVRKGRIWCWCGPPGAIRYMATPTREGRWAEEFLGDYEGFIQADAYSGFDRLFRDGSRTEVGCWAHARRKFYEALEEEPARAAVVIAGIRKLFRIEETASKAGLTTDERHALRQEKAAPVHARLFRYLETLQAELRPNSLFRKAVNYAMNQRKALTTYLTDGRLCIDNNRSERSLRAVALGRKNWLFAGSAEGADRAAIAYSLIRSAIELGINPRIYLADVLTRVARCPESEVPQLTPRAWKAARDAEARSDV